MHDRPLDFNVTEYEKFVEMFSDSTLQLTFKKLQFTMVSVKAKRNMYKCLKNVFTDRRNTYFNKLFFKLFNKCNRLNAETNMRCQLSLFSQTLKKFAKIANNATHITNFLLK